VVTRQVSCLATTLWSMFYAPVSSMAPRDPPPVRIQRDTESGHPASPMPRLKDMGAGLPGAPKLHRHIMTTLESSFLEPIVFSCTMVFGSFRHKCLQYSTICYCFLDPLMLQMLTPFVAPGLKKQPSKGRRSSGFMDIIDHRNPPAPKVLGRDLPDGTRKRLQVYLAGGGHFSAKTSCFW